VEQLVINVEDGGTIEEEDVRMDLTKAPEEKRFKTLKELEEEHILNVLKITGNNKRRAAELLGIDLSTLYRKLKSMAGAPQNPSFSE